MSTFFVITTSDILGLVILFVFVMALLYANAITMRKQARCKHDKGVRETRACDAICNTCGKNLGFIGNYRAAQQKSSKT